MLSLIRSLFRRREETDPGLPLETMTTTIAYPDGTQATSYRSGRDSSARNPNKLPVSMLADLRAPYPHIAERISLTWGTPVCEEYLASLLFDDRAVDKQNQYAARSGFNPEVMTLLMQLQDEHQRHFAGGGSTISASF